MDTLGWAATAFHIIQEQEETSGFMCGGCMCIFVCAYDTQAVRVTTTDKSTEKTE